MNTTQTTTLPADTSTDPEQIRRRLIGAAGRQWEDTAAAVLRRLTSLWMEGWRLTESLHTAGTPGIAATSATLRQRQHDLEQWERLHGDWPHQLLETCETLLIFLSARPLPDCSLECIFHTDPYHGHAMHLLRLAYNGTLTAVCHSRAMGMRNKINSSRYFCGLPPRPD